MDQESKCVVIVNEDDAPGVAANTIACLSFGLGAAFPEAVVEPIADKDDVSHGGIINRPVPILKANSEMIADIFLRAKDADVHVLDMNNKAQEAHTLEEYKKMLAESSTNELKYAGIAVYGSKKVVNKLTGSLKLLR